MTRIFISYRRSDTGPFAGRLYDRLVGHFGEDNIFKDVDNIPAGSDFRGEITRSVSRSDVMLVLIGRNWDFDRLHAPGDFVRQEIEDGLQRLGCLVIPVLVDDTPMPSSRDLPDSIRELAFRNAMLLRDDPDFHPDVNRLIRQIESNDTLLPVALTQRPSHRLNLGLVAVAMALIALLVVVLSGLLNGDESSPPGISEDELRSTVLAELAGTQSAYQSLTATAQTAVAVAPTGIADAYTPTLTSDTDANATQSAYDATATVEAQATDTQIALNDLATTGAQATQTQDALLVIAQQTAEAYATHTQVALDATATAAVWTETFTVTYTATPTPSSTPTERPTATASSTLRPTRTPRPTPISISIPQMPDDSLIYFEDFEDGEANGWSHDQQYVIMDDGTGNHVWRVLSGQASLTDSEEWTDYVLEINYVVLDWGSNGSWNVDLGARNSSHWYNLYIDKDWIGFSKRSGQMTVSDDFPGDNAFNFGNKWHTVRIMVQGSTVKYQRDDESVLVANIETGYATGIGLFAWKTEEIWFDDIRVWRLAAQ